MPFDDRSFPDAEAAALRRRRHWVALWLFTVAFMIWGMVVLGGATRLTGSGLSIMEWAPVSGAFPPVSAHEWNRLFTLYKQIPQYSLLHPDMTLAGFKSIFWLEWLHRAWGRLIGLAILLPLVGLAWAGAMPRRMLPRLAGLFALLVLQGAVGWFMVASGFMPESTAVAPARLVVHLTLAMTLFAAVFWTALSTAVPVPTSILGAAPLKRLAVATVVLTALTIVAGGFTAGLHAGLEYDSFPLMDGRLVPAGYAALHPFLRNLVANVAAVQFDHRLLATLTAGSALATLAMGLRVHSGLPMASGMALACTAFLVLLQYGLGVVTLLTHVAIPLAMAHQANAVALLASALLLTHTLRGAR